MTDPLPSLEEADRHPRVREVARALASGIPVDWGAAESTAPDGVVRELIRELRVVSAIASLNSGPPEAAHTAPVALVRWGPLVLHEKIGQGSFGEVYRAWDLRLDREVALKLLRPGREPADPHDAAALAEGRALARVRHPNIVTIHGADRIDGRVGLWMEYVHGRTLEEILREHGPLSAREAALTGIDVCRAVSALHQQGLLHRDIKTQNVMREEGGRTVLMDFGAAVERQIDADAEPALAGTPLYVAPEVLAGGPPTAPGEIYAIGILLFHLVTASFPVSERSLGEVREAHDAGRRRRLGDLRPDLPRAFVDVVDAAIAPDPMHRFATPGLMEDALAASLTEPVSSSRAALPDAARDVVTGEPRRRTWTHVAGPAAAVVLLLLTAAAILTPPVLGRLRGAAGGSTQMALRAVARPSDPTARRLPLPDWAVVGRPSRDGSFIPYTDVQGDLAVFDVASGTSRTLTQTKGSGEEAGRSAPSPDGSLIAYGWHALDGGLELRVTRADGTRPRVLLRPEGVTEIAALDWTPEGTDVIAATEARDGRHTLLRVAADGSGRTVTLKQLRRSRPLLASASPDGSLLVFDAWNGGPAGSRDVFVIGLDGRGELALADSPATEAFPMWSPSGDAVTFLSGEESSPTLWEQAIVAGRPDGPPKVVARDLGRIMGLGLGADREFFYVRQSGVVDVFTADPTEGWRVTRAASSESKGQSLTPAWSADGTLAWIEIAGYIRADRATRRIVVQPARGQAARTLVPDMAFFLSPAWAPAGDDVAVIGADGRNRWGLHRVNTVTAARTALLPAPRGDEAWFQAVQWPNDHSVAYATTSRIVARELDSGVETELADATEEGLATFHPASFGGRVFGVAPDGRSVAFSGYEGEAPAVTHVLRVKPLGGTARTLVQSQRPLRSVFQAWSADGRDVFFTRNTAGEADVALWRVRADGGEPRPTGLVQPHLRSVSVHPHSGRVAFTAGTERYEVWVLEGASPEPR